MGSDNNLEEGFHPDVLPEELTSLVADLEASQPPKKLKGKQKKDPSGFLSEARHYWAEACDLPFVEPADRISFAVLGFRQRFKGELKKIGR